MNSEKRVCLKCEKKLEGRRDKKFLKILQKSVSLRTKFRYQGKKVFGYFGTTKKE